MSGSRAARAAVGLSPSPPGSFRSRRGATGLAPSGFPRAAARHVRHGAVVRAHSQTLYTKAALASTERHRHVRAPVRGIAHGRISYGARFTSSKIRCPTRSGCSASPARSAAGPRARRAGLGISYRRDDSRLVRPAASVGGVSCSRASRTGVIFITRETVPTGARRHGLALRVAGGRHAALLWLAGEQPGLGRMRCARPRLRRPTCRRL